MSLRVTQTMMNAQLLRNVSNNLGRMNTLQNQLSTGRRINAPSDDPVGLTFTMRYRSEISSNDQYVKNTDASRSTLEYTDMVLGQLGDVLQRARELAVQGSNGALSQESYDAIKIEMKELYNQIVEISNSSFNGKYVFNGEQTQTAPYPRLTIDDASGAEQPFQVGADDGSIRYEISPGMLMTVNISGNQIFGEPVLDADDPDSDNLFLIIRQMHDALENGQNTSVSGLLERVDSRMSKLLEMRAEVGARTNRVNLVMGRLEENNLNLKAIQTRIEYADMAEVITNLKMEENVYQASLSAGAKLISPSLVDFLR